MWQHAYDLDSESSFGGSTYISDSHDAWCIWDIELELAEDNPNEQTPISDVASLIHNKPTKQNPLRMEEQRTTQSQKEHLRTRRIENQSKKKSHPVRKVYRARKGKPLMDMMDMMDTVIGTQSKSTLVKEPKLYSIVDSPNAAMMLIQNGNIAKAVWSETSIELFQPDPTTLGDDEIVVRPPAWLFEHVDPSFRDEILKGIDNLAYDFSLRL
jgi:hypothetical protein